MITTTIHTTSLRRSLNRAVLVAAASAATVGVSLAVPAAASATEGPPGCNGLYERARFATFQQVGDTHGHETVHHVFERLGCGEPHGH